MLATAELEVVVLSLLQGEKLKKSSKQRVRNFQNDRKVDLSFVLSLIKMK